MRLAFSISTSVEADILLPHIEIDDRVGATLVGEIEGAAQVVECEPAASVAERYQELDSGVGRVRLSVLARVGGLRDTDKLLGREHQVARLNLVRDGVVERLRLGAGRVR